MAQGVPQGNNVTKLLASNDMRVAESRTSKANTESHASQHSVIESRVSKANNDKESRASKSNDDTE